MTSDTEREFRLREFVRAFAPRFPEALSEREVLEFCVNVSGVVGGWPPDDRGLLKLVGYVVTFLNFAVDFRDGRRLEDREEDFYRRALEVLGRGKELPS